MRASQADYLRLLVNLMPKGPAWSESDPLLAGAAEELARLHNRVMDLLEEYDPRTTVELFGEWETEYGLPDPCLITTPTLIERRAALFAKVFGLGGQSREFFIAVAAALGFTITITEFRPFRVGHGAAGDPLCGEDWYFAWQVNAPLTTVRDFSVGLSAVGDALRIWGNALLECVINRLKPAHTIVLYSYT